jgi:hypothetical protein
MQRLALPAAITALVISLGANVATQVYGSEQRRDAREAHDALCAFRNDLVYRVEFSRRLLEEQPELIERFGLTEETVRANLDNQERTIRTLDTLSCGSLSTFHPTPENP